MTALSIDIETRSEADLLKHGLQAYATHPSTRVLIFGYAIDDNEPQAWLPHEGRPPAELVDACKDPHVEKHAWNSPFEDALLSNVMRLSMPWYDTMVMALYASLPGSLAGAGAAMGLDVEMLKNPQGKKLIRKFSIPTRTGAFNDWTTHPDDFAEFVQYCKQDVVAERAIKNKLAKMPVPESEWALWRLDQKINRRGVPVDLDFVNSALTLCRDEKNRLLRILRRDTGIWNVTTQAAFLTWARDNGYPYNDLRKDTVAKAIREGAVSQDLARLLTMRGDVSKTSTSKFETIASMAQGGRAYNTLQFYGAARTGRWAGRGIQIQNLPRPIREAEGHEAHITDMVKNADHDGLLLEYGRAMPVVSSVIRSAFRAPKGKVLYTADLNAIENRVLGWLAGCDAILDVFKNNRDPYKDFATRMFGVPYEAVTKEQRTISKPGVLGCGYMLGGGEQTVNKNGDTILTGLWGYSASMGIEMTREQAHEAVRVFRAAYPEVGELWSNLKDAAFKAVFRKTTTAVGPVTMRCDGKVLEFILPSGRSLYYIQPRLENVTRVLTELLPDGTIKAEKVTSLNLTYMNQNQTTKRWERTSTHAGKITENLVQAIARDVLAAGLVAADKKGFEVVMHLHDEIVCEVPLDSPLTLQDLIDCMTADLPWAGGLPLAAAGEITEFFKK